MNKKIETLYKNEWISLKNMNWPEKDISGYVYSHETRCDGKIIAILPYKIENMQQKYLLRKEVTPCWNPEKEIISSITGGFEKDKGIKGTVVLELREEAGFKANEKELISLGTCRGTKSSDTVYHLFTIDVTNKKPVKATGDGSALETKATCVWKDDLAGCEDPIAYTLYYRLTRKMIELYY